MPSRLYEHIRGVLLLQCVDLSYLQENNADKHICLKKFLKSLKSFYMLSPFTARIIGCYFLA